MDDKTTLVGQHAWCWWWYRRKALKDLSPEFAVLAVQLGAGLCNVSNNWRAAFHPRELHGLCGGNVTPADKLRGASDGNRIEGLAGGAERDRYFEIAQHRLPWIRRLILAGFG